MERKPQRQKKNDFALNNQTLLVLIGVLAAVLVVLLVHCYPHLRYMLLYM